MMLTGKDLINMVRGKFSHHLTKEEKDYIRLNLDEKPDLPYNSVPRIKDVYPDW